MKLNSIPTLTAACLLVSATAGFSSSGIFGTGLAISSDINGVSAFNLYETTALGDSRLTPSNPGSGGVSLGVPTLITTSYPWTVSTPTSFGTFKLGVDTLTLNGGEELTYKNSGSDVSGAQVFYTIDGGSFNQINMAFNQDNVNGAGGDQRWYTDGANVNLLNGLSVGTHTLTFYFRDDNTATTHDYISNLGANYTASFTVAPVPEPTTGLIVASGLGLLGLMRRRR